MSVTKTAFLSTHKRSEKVTKAVITDAGYATRFLPITKTIPKSMLPLHNKPAIQYVVEECQAAGIKEIILVTTPEWKPIFEDYFNNSVLHIYDQLKKQGKADRFKEVSHIFELPKVTIITQDRSLPYGNAIPLLCAKPYVNGSPFIYAYTDDMMMGSSGMKELIEAFEAEGSQYTVYGLVEDDSLDISKYGVASLKNGNKIDHIIEKPDPKKVKSKLVHPGRCLITSNFYDYFDIANEDPGKSGEWYTSNIVEKMAQDVPVIGKIITRSKWLTIGDPINYTKTFIEYALRKESTKPEILSLLKQHL